MTTLTSWVCPMIVDDKGNVVSGGCGGNWGEHLPERCPTCKGPLKITQRVACVSL